LADIQDQILSNASALVAPGGVLAYVTCSLFKVENIERVERFVAQNPRWTLAYYHQWTLPKGGDGFFAAHLVRGSK
jgi:16S rRNA (cytosine967-C5)-methyltransferase